jgi:hypothetical protein
MRPRNNPYSAWANPVAVEFRPVTAWPGPPTPERERRSANFKLGWQDTIGDLKRELYYLEADQIVVELETDERAIRRDGLPRDDIRTNGPGVIVSFQTPIGPLRYPCDTYTRWQDNLRAIALALEALRAVDRYGVTKRGEQYTGWKALPASTGPTMTTDAAAKFVAHHAGYAGEAASLQNAVDGILDSPRFFARAYRLAAMRLHPDQGGSHEDFHTLQTAKQVLDKHHGQ